MTTAPITEVCVRNLQTVLSENGHVLILGQGSCKKYQNKGIKGTFALL